GLFGPWGSGKTTFLKRLRRVVDQRAEEARTAIKSDIASEYVGNVVHVEFNAWHFAEDALVSSLIDAIVRELRAFIKDDYAAIGPQLLALRTKTAESARRTVEEARTNEAAARKDVEDKAATVTKNQALARKSAVDLSEALRSVWNETVEALKSST